MFDFLINIGKWNNTSKRQSSLLEPYMREKQIITTCICKSLINLNIPSDLQGFGNSIIRKIIPYIEIAKYEVRLPHTPPYKKNKQTFTMTPKIICIQSKTSTHFSLQKKLINVYIWPRRSIVYKGRLKAFKKLHATKLW